MFAGLRDESNDLSIADGHSIVTSSRIEVHATAFTVRKM